MLCSLMSDEVLLRSSCCCKGRKRPSNSCLFSFKVMTAAGDCVTRSQREEIEATSVRRQMSKCEGVYGQSKQY